jgi:hypothetical protein
MLSEHQHEAIDNLAKKFKMPKAKPRKSGGRKAPQISQEELKDKIMAYVKKNWYAYGFDDNDLTELNDIDHEIVELLAYKSNINNDLGKVRFDTENCGFVEGHHDNVLLGFQTLENGFTFLGCYAGGDWENSVFFIIYWDGKSLRGYVPENGNIYNQLTDTAYGSEMSSDWAYSENTIKKKIPGLVQIADNYLRDATEHFFYCLKMERRNDKIDVNLVVNDIKNRIEIIV